MHTISTLVLLTSVLALGLVATITTTTLAPTSILGQAFDITTEQSTDVATITVQLAQPNETVVIPPNGSIIQVPATNITVIDNDTVVIVPENETVTELPGNVTVITPPEPEPCGCPVANETGAPAAAAGIEDLIVRPATGQNVQIYGGPVPEQNLTAVTPAEPPPAAAIAPEEPLLPVPGEGENATDVIIEQPGNVTIGEPEGNLTVEEPAASGNDTGGLTPTALRSETPWWMPF